MVLSPVNNELVSSAAPGSLQLDIGLPGGSHIFDPDELNGLFARMNTLEDENAKQSSEGIPNRPGVGSQTSQEAMDAWQGLSTRVMPETSMSTPEISSSSRLFNIFTGSATRWNMAQSGLLRLPPELLDVIFDLIHISYTAACGDRIYDMKTMRACTLVCRDLHPFPRARLFATRTLCGSGDDMDRTWMFLRGHPEAYALARHLSLKALESPILVATPQDGRDIDMEREPSPPRSHWRLDVRLGLLLHPLTHVQVLEMASTRFWANFMLDGLLGPVIKATFRSVVELTIQSTFMDMYALYLFLCNFPVLRSLTITRFVFPNEFLVDTGSESQTPKLLALHTLVLPASSTLSLRDYLLRYIVPSALRHFSGPPSSSEAPRAPYVVANSTQRARQMPFLERFGKHMVSLGIYKPDFNTGGHVIDLSGLAPFIAQHCTHLQRICIYSIHSDMALALPDMQAIGCSSIRECTIVFSHASFKARTEDIAEAYRIISVQFPQLERFNFVGGTQNRYDVLVLDSGLLTALRDSREHLRRSTVVDKSTLNTYDLLGVLGGKLERLDNMGDVTLGVKTRHSIYKENGRFVEVLEGVYIHVNRHTTVSGGSANMFNHTERPTMKTPRQTTIRKAVRRVSDKLLGNSTKQV